MKKLLALILIIFGLYSCKPDQPAQQHQQQIDSLLTRLGQMNEQLNSLRIREVQQFHDSLKRHYDTIQPVDSSARSFKHMQRSTNLLNWYDNITREITFSRSHLRSLERQMDGQPPDSSVIKQITKEKQIVGNLEERFGEEYRELQKAMKELLNK